MLLRRCTPALRAVPSSPGFSASPPQLLRGIRVLELASVLAGPSVGQYLAELGADVVKVENARAGGGGGGDVTRSWLLSGEAAPDGRSAYFHAANAGKRSIAVNALVPEGLAVLQRLAARADVVVASYKPGDAERLQLDYASLAAENEGLVYASITGYGTGVRRAGYDAAVQAESGFQFINGEPEAAPTKMPVAMVDLLAAHQLKEAVLLALWQRERTGQGTEVHVSLVKAAVASLANQASAYLKTGRVPQRMGSDHPSISPYGTVFETADGKLLTLAVGSDAQYRQLCEELAMEVPDSLATNRLRVANKAECKAGLADAIRLRTRDEFLAALQARAVPCGSVNAMDDVFEMPQAQEVVVRDPGGGYVGLRQSVSEFRGGGAGAEEEGGGLPAPPTYGEHTREVLQSLGYSETEVSKLYSDAAVA